jgi:flagellar L-ring protein precursor FlgH
MNGQSKHFAVAHGPRSTVHRPPCFSRNLHFALIFILVSFYIPAALNAQNSSLFGRPDPNRGLILTDYSWTYQKPNEPHPIRLHDLVTVQVDEKSVVTSQGQMDRKKKAYGDLKLPNWILLKGLAAVPDPQTAGVPHVRGEIDNKMQSQANLQTKDWMKFLIACEVVDIRPNGNLVIEGRRTIKNNEDTWEYSLSGEIRAEDVLPNNTVLSQNVSNMRLAKREEGHVRDGYRRGWALEWLDKYQPF